MENRLKPTIGRTGRADADSGRGKHAASGSCLPNAQAPEEHDGLEHLRYWQPMNDGVFIERLEDIERPDTNKIILTDMATADNEMLLRKGMVISVGPGKWVDGTWWKFKTGWEWIPGYREQPTVKPGQLVIFNARWNDLKDRDLANRLDYRLSERVHLVQESDIAGILG